MLLLLNHPLARKLKPDRVFTRKHKRRGKQKTTHTQAKGRNKNLHRPVFNISVGYNFPSYNPPLTLSRCLSPMQNPFVLFCFFIVKMYFVFFDHFVSSVQFVSSLSELMDVENPFDCDRNVQQRHHNAFLYIPISFYWYYNSERPQL